MLGVLRSDTSDGDLFDRLSIVENEREVVKMATAILVMSTDDGGFGTSWWWWWCTGGWRDGAVPATETGQANLVFSQLWSLCPKALKLSGSPLKLSYDR